MKATALLFADYATVREGLLNVLGAGITRLVRDPLPGRLDAVLAMLLQPADFDDLTADHNVEVNVTQSAPDGAIPIAKAVIELSSAITAPGAVAPPPIPLVVPLQSVLIPRTGSYRIEAIIDGESAGTYLFEVVKAAAATP